MESSDDFSQKKEKGSCFFPGVGCMDLTNIKSVHGSKFDEVVDRITSTGAGAFGGMVNYINHNGRSDGDGPNVRVQWPSQEVVAHKPEWLEQDINFLRDTIDTVGLSFDYEALRDSKQGEEVFMVYGDEWAGAWENT
ncbi:hypothetical protein IV203_009915 [Nitzschia inconspicua]|uniref:Uncharacterized protein n=1 Tax=Nitzschia inconspicua TaxID=303405 RepID=A0A9K3KV15_9STRA|nr:hypothetical protein IV203_009915 [Nitzschia inconspicua]